MSLPEPDFINRDPDAITAELVAQYEQLTGKTLYPAQVERVFINVMAYRESLVRIGIQEAAKQNLVAFARAPMLDYLGELVGCYRLAAQPARVTVRFTLEVVQGMDLLIPAGTRVESSNGAASFATDADGMLPAGQLSIDIAATCEQTGIVGNGWQPGQIANLIDDLGVIVNATNTVVSSSGVADEEDDRYRERIKLAPESFSVAGSRQAYRYHAMSTHQSIVDVAVLSPVPGSIQLFPLLESGLPDANMLALVAATCSDERVRPLCDDVQVFAPRQVNYSITAQIILYSGVDAASVMQQVQAAAEVYVADRAAGLGRDIVPSQIDAALSVPGVYRVMHSTPLLEVAEEEWAFCTGTALTLTGTSYG